MMGTRRAFSGRSWGLIVGRSGFCSSKGTPERSQAAATRSGYKGHPRPVSAPAVSPQGPGNFGQFRVSALLSQVFQALLESFARAVSRIAPHLAVGFARLFVGGGKQSAIVPAGQRLPVEIPGPGKSGFAGTLSASVLVNDHAAQGLDSLRDPNRVLDRKNQFSRFARGFVAYPVIGWGGVRKGVVRRILARKECKR